MAVQQEKSKAAAFDKFLAEQKQEEKDPKFAISDALQEYTETLQRSMKKGNFRSEVLNFVDGYITGTAEELKGQDFDEALTSQKVAEKSIDEFENLAKKKIITEEELNYIKETVGKANAELKNVLGLSTRLSLSFRDFKKELKPLKLAKRVGLTRVPIIGKRIERVIEAEDRAEADVLRAKRNIRKQELRKKRGLDDEPDITPDTTNEDIAKDTMSQVLGVNNLGKTKGLSKEGRVEEERESDEQFEETSTLLEQILEENKTTNELLGKELGDLSEAIDGQGGVFSKALGGLGTALGLGAGYKVAKKFMGKGGPKPSKGMPKGPMVANTGTSKVAKNNMSKGTSLAKKTVKGAARLGGRLFLPVAAVMSLFDAATGVAQADELLGKEEDNLTFRDKASAGVAGFLSGLTFGLVDKEKTAKKLAGGTDKPNFKDTSFDDGSFDAIDDQLVKDTSSKVSTANEIQADGVEKGAAIIQNSNNSGNTTINNNSQQNNVTSNDRAPAIPNVGTSGMDTTIMLNVKGKNVY